MVRRVEGVRREVAEASRRPPFPERAQRVAVVLDQPQIVILGDLRYRADVPRVAEGMGQHDPAGLGPDGRGDLLGNRVVAAEIDIHENRNQAVQNHGANGGGEARGHGDYLVARLESPIAELRRRQRGDRQQVG